MVSELFSDLQGQPLATQLLQAALELQRVAPAYLFSGPEGVGRRLAALRFMEGVLSGGAPDSRERRRLEERNHPDLLWVEPTYSHQGRLLSKAEAEAAGVNRRTPPQVRLEQIRDLGRFLARQPLESALVGSKQSSTSSPRSRGQNWTQSAAADPSTGSF